MKFLILKNVFIFVFLGLVVTTVASCTQNAEVKDDDAKASKALVGVWRGEGGYEEGADVGWKESWKMVRTADGNYTVDYLTQNDSEKLYEHSSDSGTWSYKDGVYHETNKNGYDISYTVYSVKDDWFEYNLSDREGEQHIQETKTEEAYQLPSPPEGYAIVDNSKELSDLIEGTVDQATDEATEAVKQAIEKLSK